MRCRWLLPLLPLAACAPDQVGQQVGRSLYDASVDTGHAIATLGDRTGAALQHAGRSLRTTVAAPADRPPPLYPLDAPGAVTTEPLGPPGSPPIVAPDGAPGYDPYRDGPYRDGLGDTPPNPALGY